jgi:hypothetical protein
MSKDIILREANKIDPVKIIGMAFNKEKWGEKYTLYAHKGITITCSISSFDFENNSAIFILKGVGIYEGEKYDNSTSTEFYVERDDLKSFTNRLNKDCLYLFESSWGYNSCIMRKISETMIESDQYSSYDLNSEDIIEAGFEEELDEVNAISNEEFRDAAYDRLMEDVVEKVNEPYEKEKEERYKEVKESYTDFIELREVIQNE